MSGASLRTPFLFGFLLFAALFVTTQARAGDVTITIKDGLFSPRNITVPAGQKVKLTIVNQNPTVVEFESTDLNREKVVTPGGSIIVYIGPLDPGAYGFFDDFHRETTGTITAK
jgi:RPA family protein